MNKRMQHSQIKICNRSFTFQNLWRLRKSFFRITKRLQRWSVLKNIIKFISIQLFPTDKILGYPFLIMLEPTSRCNLRCPMCAVTILDNHRPKHDLSFEDFIIIFEKFKSYALVLAFWNFGEPLLNKDVFSMIECAHKHNIFTVLTTNGILLNEKNIKELFVSELDYLVISMDGATAETYETYRCGAHFKTLIANIQFLVSEKKKLMRTSPFIEITFLIMRKNEREIALMEKLAKELEVDKLTFRKVSFDYQVKQPNIEEFLPQNYNYRHPIYLSDYARKKVCSLPWYHMVINSDGNVVPCCQDFSSLQKMGNLIEQSLEDIWKGSNYIHFRAKVLQNIDQIDLCRTCPDRNFNRKKFLSQQIDKGRL